MVIKCTGKADAEEIVVHESVIERSSPAFRDLVEQYRAAGTVVLSKRESVAKFWNRRGLTLEKYVQFLYTNEIAKEGLSEDGSETFESLFGLTHEWLLGLSIRDVRYCNAVMDQLMGRSEGEQIYLLFAAAVAFRKGLEGERRTPLWTWLVEHIGATLSELDVESVIETEGLLNFPSSFLMDLLRRVLQQRKGKNYRRAPTLDNNKKYHLAQDQIDEAWRIYDRDT